MPSLNAATNDLTLDEMRAIAKDAYVYGFPMVDLYRIVHSYAVDRTGRDYKGEWNQLHSSARVYTPADTTIQTPNSDTPYGSLVADLRTEPLVITLPVIEDGRYFSVQFVDGYTYVFGLLGTRTTGNDGGSYLLAGPDWGGETPAGVDGVLTCPTTYAMVLFRTQLFSPDDVSNVAAIQSQYRVMPLSEFTHRAAPEPAPPIDFYRPLSVADERTSLEFFSELCFVLSQAPTMSGEEEIRERLARLGIAPGEHFDAASLSPEQHSAIAGGVADAWAEMNQNVVAKLLSGEVSSGDLFGSRAELGDNYLYRMAGAVVGILGLPGAEARYFPVKQDSDGVALTGANRYTLTFDEGQLPPVQAFWSVTMYRLPEILLVANPIDRYLINSPMLGDLTRDDDGSITLYLQRSSPGGGNEANWLPTPDGDFECILRTYCPAEAVLEGRWLPPRPVRVQ
ncbi:MAG: DUF1254 domain-containing protein [Gordonia sp. (in: high G+C Gram-positive bacteria)]|uniref:DUF1254 domain-containing protein n=1 Tax=Gordonia sp. (in: high G+C Gram-positive bacteria) TaxID=84139 RepID=UPI003BB6C463